MTYSRMEAKLIADEHCRFCGDARAALVKTPGADQWICCDTAFVSFRGGGDVKWSMNALACAMPTIRISMEGRGKGVRNAVMSGHPDMTNSRRRIPSTGPNIEEGRWVLSGPNHEHEKCPPEGIFRRLKLGRP